MAVFYLLPSRPVVGERLAHFLEAWLPGLHCSPTTWPELAEGLGSLLYRQTDSYVIFREDLPLEEDVTQALKDGFGAEEGDEVVEVEADFWAGDLSGRRWHVHESQAA